MWRFVANFLYGPPEEPTPAPPAYDPEHEPPPLGDVIQRGMAATRLLGDPTLAEAFKEIRAEAYQDFVGSKPTEAARREEVYRIIQALELVRQKLIHYRDTARLREDLRQDQEAA